MKGFSMHQLLSDMRAELRDHGDVKLITPISTSFGRRLQIDFQDAQQFYPPSFLINDIELVPALIICNTIDRDGSNEELNDLKIVLESQMKMKTYVVFRLITITLHLCFPPCPKIFNF